VGVEEMVEYGPYDVINLLAAIGIVIAAFKVMK
jgi:hypothetical protein